MTRKLIALLSLAALSACSDSSRREEDNPNHLRADMDVTMSAESFGCEFPERFTEALDHKARDEYSAWSAIVNDSPFCFSGADQMHGQTWTVMQIRGAVMQIGLSGPSQSQEIMELPDGAPRRRGHYYWTATRWGRSDFSPRASAPGN